MVRYYNGDYVAAVEIIAKANRDFPEDATILYNLACFESLSGLQSDTVAHLSQAISLDESFHEHAKTDGDFDSLRAIPEFNTLLTL